MSSKKTKNRKKRGRDRLKESLVHLSSPQKDLVNGILQHVAGFHEGNMSDLISYAGDTEVTNVLLEAAWFDMDKDLQESVTSLTTFEGELLSNLQDLGWILEGSSELRPFVRDFVQRKKEIRDKR